MNWMTSGRKRVQRSQKIKELRAKHFAKVAADRARSLPLSARSGSSAPSRQSADVCRLKSRWTQASHPEQPASRNTISATVQRRDPTSPATEQAAHSGSPAVAVAALGGGTPEGPFEAGMLVLDVTPPPSSVPSVYQSNSSGGRKVGARSASSVRQAPRDFSRPSDQQQPAPPSGHGRTHEYPAHALPLERRQLSFGGAGGEGRDFGVDYEGQLLGSDDKPGGVAEVLYQTSGVLPDNADGTPTDQRAGPVDQWDRFGTERGNPMRFFNAGIEVAHDGSPVPDEPPAMSSRLAGTTPARPPLEHGRIVNFERPSGRGDSAGGGGAGGGGLQRFSIGGLLGGGLPPATPSSPWAGRGAPGTHDMRGHDGSVFGHERACSPSAVQANIPPGYDQVDYAPQENNAENEGDILEPSKSPMQHPIGPPVLPPYVGLLNFVSPSDMSQTDTPCVHDNGLFQQPLKERYGDTQEKCSVLEAPTVPSAGHTKPADFEVLARTWGLFGGVLDSPSTPGAAIATASASIQTASRATYGNDPESKDGVELKMVEHCPDGLQERGLQTGVLGSTSPQGKPLKKHPCANDSSEYLSLGPGREHDEDRSGSPELVMFWDVDETLLQVEHSQDAMADQARDPRSRQATSPHLSSANKGALTKCATQDMPQKSVVMEEQQGRTVCLPQPTISMVATQEQHQQTMLGHDKLSTGEGIQQPSLANDTGTTPGISVDIMRQPGQNAGLHQNAEQLPPRPATIDQLSESRVGGGQDRSGRELFPPSAEGVAGGGITGHAGNVSRATVGQGSCIVARHDRPKSPGSEVAEKDEKGMVASLRGSSKSVNTGVQQSVAVPPPDELHLHGESRKSSCETTQDECPQKDNRNSVKRRGEPLSKKTGHNRRARRWSKRVGGNTTETSTEARNAQSSREDDYSTIVWYRTIVACLKAAS